VTSNSILQDGASGSIEVWCYIQDSSVNNQDSEPATIVGYQDNLANNAPFSLLPGPTIWLDTADGGRTIQAGGFLTTHVPGTPAPDLSYYSLLLDFNYNYVGNFYNWLTFQPAPGNTGAALSRGQWNQIVMTWDGTPPVLTMYVNGVKQATITAGSSYAYAPRTYTAPNFVLQSWGGSGDSDLNLDIAYSHLAIFGDALTPDEVKAHWLAEAESTAITNLAGEFLASDPMATELNVTNLAIEAIAPYVVLSAAAASNFRIGDPAIEHDVRFQKVHDDLWIGDLAIGTPTPPAPCDCDVIMTDLATAVAVPPSVCVTNLIVGHTDESHAVPPSRCISGFRMADLATERWLPEKHCNTGIVIGAANTHQWTFFRSFHDDIELGDNAYPGQRYSVSAHDDIYSGYTAVEFDWMLLDAFAHSDIQAGDSASLTGMTHRWGMLAASDIAIGDSAALDHLYVWSATAASQFIAWDTALAPDPLHALATTDINPDAEAVLAAFQEALLRSAGTVLVLGAAPGLVVNRVTYAAAATDAWFVLGASEVHHQNFQVLAATAIWPRLVARETRDAYAPAATTAVLGNTARQGREIHVGAVTGIFGGLGDGRQPLWHGKGTSNTRIGDSAVKAVGSCPAGVDLMLQQLAVGRVALPWIQQTLTLPAGGQIPHS
jgi:hypothetical protein